MAHAQRFMNRPWANTSDFVDTIPVVHPAEALRHVRSDLPHDECTAHVCEDIDDLERIARPAERVIGVVLLAVLCALFLVMLPGCGGGSTEYNQNDQQDASYIKRKPCNGVVAYRICVRNADGSEVAQ